VLLDDVLPELSPPRRRALEIALLLEETSGDPVDRRALAVAGLVLGSGCSRSNLVFN